MTQQHSPFGPATLPAALAAEIDALPLDRGRPLLIVDADEVLFLFMAGLERHLNDGGLSFDWSSYGLLGNVRDAQGIAIDRARLQSELASFFERHTARLEPVPGAAEALAALAGRGIQIVVLSNVPPEQHAARLQALTGAAMPYPLLANAGPKGPAVARLAARVDAPTIFVDDLAHQHSSVRNTAPSVLRLHFVADPRLAKLLAQATDSDQRLDDWTALRAAIEAHLDKHGLTVA